MNLRWNQRFPWKNHNILCANVPIPLDNRSHILISCNFLQIIHLFTCIFITIEKIIKAAGVTSFKQGIYGWNLKFNVLIFCDVTIVELWAPHYPSYSNKNRRWSSLDMHKIAGAGARHHHYVRRDHARIHLDLLLGLVYPRVNSRSPVKQFEVSILGDNKSVPNDQ